LAPTKEVGAKVNGLGSYVEEEARRLSD
jgi:hypothetical protein